MLKLSAMQCKRPFMLLRREHRVLLEGFRLFITTDATPPWTLAQEVERVGW